jgi:hypothetical protein
MNILKIGIGVILVESVTAQVSAVSTSANGAGASAMGDSTTAYGYVSTAMGLSTTADGYVSTAMGKQTTAYGDFSTAMGEQTTASGWYSTAMGKETTASDYASVSIGQYNSAGYTVTNSATSFNAGNTAFVIGNGADLNNLSDAFKVMFNGDATVYNDLTVVGTLKIDDQVLTGVHVAQLLNLLTQLEGSTDDQKACLKTKWNALSTC